jgi:hypothetical protein
MPLGISESAIKAAYGPIDLSGLYKGIEAIVKKSEYTDKLERQALQKEYYTSLASLNKNKDKMNPHDSEEFMSHYNRYKSAQQRLISNPKLIESNPEEYGKLTSESEDAYTKASTLVNTSKLMQDKISKMHDYASKNPEKFEDGALQTISSLSNMKTADIINMGLDDMSKYVYQGPDLQKFTKELSGIENDKNNRISARIITHQDAQNKAYVYNSYNILDPVKISNDVNSLLSLQRSPSKAASSILEKFGDQVDQVASDYSNLKDEDFAKFKTAEGADLFPMHHPFGDVTIPQTRKPDLKFDASTPQAKLSAFLTARPIVSSIKSPVLEKANQTYYEGGETGKKEFASKLALKLQSSLMAQRQIYAQQNMAQAFDNKRIFAEENRELGGTAKLLFGLLGDDYRDKLVNQGIDFDNATTADIMKLTSEITGQIRKSTPKKKLY